MLLLNEQMKLEMNFIETQIPESSLLIIIDTNVITDDTEESYGKTSAAVNL